MSVKRRENSYFDPNTTAALCDRFGLDNDKPIRYWPIGIVDSNRVEEFLNAYQNEFFEIEQRFALMELILYSFEGVLLGDDIPRKEITTESIQAQLTQDWPLSSTTVMVLARPSNKGSPLQPFAWEIWERLGYETA